MHSLKEFLIDIDTLKAVQAFLDHLKGSYPVYKAVLFGSRARGTFRSDSDADVAILPMLPYFWMVRRGGLLKPSWRWPTLPMMCCWKLAFAFSPFRFGMLSGHTGSLILILGCCKTSNVKV